MATVDVIGGRYSGGLVRWLSTLYRRSDAVKGYTLLSPTVLVMLAAMAAPMLLLALYSFWTQDGYTVDKHFTLDRYVEVFTRDTYRQLFYRSLYISSLVTAVTVLLAYPMAYFVAFYVSQRTKFVWLILLTIPFWTSYLLRVFAWKIILGYNGVINSGLMAMGVIHQPFEFLLYNTTAVVVTLAHAWAAFAILPIYVSLEKIDRSLLEAASDLGDGPIRRFLRITLPLSLPGVIGAAVLIFVPTTGDYVTPTLVGGSDGVMIANVIEVQFAKIGDWPMGAALAMASMAAVGLVTLLSVQAVRLAVSRDTVMGKRNYWLFGYAMLYLAFLYLPVLFLPLFSFNDSAFIAFPLAGFTTKWYGQMLADDAMHTALWNSLKVGFGVALISTALGLLAAKALTRYRLPGGAAVLGFTSLPLFIPDIVLGISILILLNVIGMPLSLISVMIGHVLICAPFAIAVLMSRFDGFDRSLEEASLDLGENAWTTFWRVTFPLVLPGIISSLLLTFIVSFDEFLIAYFLAGTDATLPIYIWGQLRFPYKLPVVLALGAVILVVSCVLVVVAEWVRGLGQRGQRRVGA